MFNKLCIVGVGLIGGSVASAARKRRLCRQIVALGRREDLENLQRARQLGIIDAYHYDPGSAVQDADDHVIATPVGAIEAVLAELEKHWSDTAIYTDTGSTKGSVIAAAKKVFGKVPANFVPAHPIAGSENSGVDAADPDLFQDKRLIITPLPDNSLQALTAVQEFWEQLGSSVASMPAGHHDAVLAATSHIPHILAFSLVEMLGKKDEQIEIFQYAAGGFKDFTRIASSDPTMWRDICLANSQEIVPLLEELQDRLAGIVQMLENQDSGTLFELFTYANQARQRFLDQIEK